MCLLASVCPSLAGQGGRSDSELEKSLHLSTVFKVKQFISSGVEKDSVKREGRSFQEVKNRNKGVEITGKLGKQQPGALKQSKCEGMADWKCQLELKLGDFQDRRGSLSCS